MKGSIFRSVPLLKHRYLMAPPGNSLSKFSVSPPYGKEKQHTNLAGAFPMLTPSFKFQPTYRKVGWRKGVTSEEILFVFCQPSGAFEVSTIFFGFFPRVDLLSQTRFSFGSFWKDSSHPKTQQFGVTSHSKTRARFLALMFFHFFFEMPCWSSSFCWGM